MTHIKNFVHLYYKKSEEWGPGNVVNESYFA